MRTDRLLEVPERYRGGIERYAQHHIPPGSFLLSVLQNDLQTALARMDRDVSLDDLRAVLSFLYNEMMPGGIYGSPAIVAAWVEKRGKCEDHCPCERWYESQPVVTT